MVRFDKPRMVSHHFRIPKVASSQSSRCLPCPMLTRSLGPPALHSPAISMQVCSLYISVGCNRGSGTSDVDGHGLVAFAAGKVVALWDTKVDLQGTLHK